MDAQDDVTDHLALITSPAQDNPDNPTMTAGMTFVGQFLDHDMTFDPTSSLARRTPTYGTGNDFRMTDLLKAAGVVGAF